MHFASGLVVQGTSTYSSAISSLCFAGDEGMGLPDAAFPFDEERRLTGKIGGKWFREEIQGGG